mmetsp:Transcript_1908/g.5733  ORF Transcript_1908/g.5733 Transcript_1908/m.5733 type:complete len:152 (+) Transcript_1908:95-550(+)
MAPPPRLLLLLVAALASRGTSGDYAGCGIEESAGIGHCVSSGQGFMLDAKKSERCPENKPFNEWTCEDWKCHMYCSNPEHGDARKSCSTCMAPRVEEACFASQQSFCREATAGMAGCDVDCSRAPPVRTGSLVACALFFAGLLSFIGPVKL